jgi:pimeloyl-ACP methyl ester carboxylesterase
MAATGTDSALVTSDGRRLAYRSIGEGPVVICHPGGPGYSGRYLFDLAALDLPVTLVLLDPRGTGGSDRPAEVGGYQTDDYVTDVEELRRHLGLERITHLGHSHGGVVAAAHAAAYPDRVERLVLANTLARFAKEQTAAMEAAMAAHADEPWYADAAAAVEQEQAGNFDGPDELAGLVKREMPFYFAQYGPREAAYVDFLALERPNADALKLFNDDVFETFDLRPVLGAITAPTLVITGERDFICGPACAADFAGIPGQRTVIVEGAGHFLFIEDPARMAAELRAFLEL